MQMDMFVRNADGKIVPAEITAQTCRKTQRIFLLVTEQRGIAISISKEQVMEEQAVTGMRKALDDWDRALPDRLANISQSFPQR